ncbi:MAG: hypothetical protein WA941_20880 [Nitrososphaeraceae archaeon]
MNPPDKDSEKEGFFSLMVFGMPVIALTDQKYIVPSNIGLVCITEGNRTQAVFMFL